jgi:hypothetical protein
MLWREWWQFHSRMLIAHHTTCKITCVEQGSFGSVTVVLHSKLDYCKASECRVHYECCGEMRQRCNLLLHLNPMAMSNNLQRCRVSPYHSYCIVRTLPQCCGELLSSCICLLHWIYMEFGKQMHDGRNSPQHPTYMAPPGLTRSISHLQSNTVFRIVSCWVCSMEWVECRVSTQ